MDTPTAEAALGLWPEAADGRATLVNLSENHTFRVDAPGGTFALRVHRPGYQSRAAIKSELAWLAALEGTLLVPRPLRGGDGEMVQELAPGQAAVLFAWEQGTEPLETGNLAPLFATLGGYAAIAHAHAAQWARPPGFTRPSWTADAILDRDGLWGDWRAAPHVEGTTRVALDALDERLRSALAAYGRPPDRFGLIHADMRLANLLVVDPGHVTLIDFDDCGFGWHLYDLAASLSFIDMRPDLQGLIDAWVGGYTARRPLVPADIAVIPAMILLRRMALLAWIGSHAETALARKHAPVFAADTMRLAARLWP